MDEKDDSQKAISDHQDDKADDISSPAIVLKGILSKRSRNLFIRGPWALRTVLLYSNNKFFYFNGKVLKGEVSLAGTEVSFVSPELADGRNYAFQIANIKTEKRVQSSTLIFAAGSQQEAEDWVYNLSAAVKSLDTLSKTAYITFEVSIKSYNLLNQCSLK